MSPVSSDPVPSVSSVPVPSVFSDPVSSVSSDTVPSFSSDPVPSVSSNPVPSVFSDPVSSVSSDPVPSVSSDLVPPVSSLGVLSFRREPSLDPMVPEDTDTETVTDMSVTVTSEGTSGVCSAQVRQCRAEVYASQVSQAERMMKGSQVRLKLGEPGDNIVLPAPSVGRGNGDPRNILGVMVYDT